MVQFRDCLGPSSTRHSHPTLLRPCQYDANAQTIHDPKIAILNAVVAHRVDSLYRAGVHHDSDRCAEGLRREVGLEMCAYDAGVA